MKNVFRFLRELEENNNREWFNDNKPKYLEAKATYEEFIGRIISGLGIIDPEIAGVQVKDCVFRIYRDTRFTHDKKPYKTHMGAFIARGGKMNPRGGYYVHAEPGNSLFSGGIWCPDTALLKALHQDIFDNIDEFRAIIEEPAFARYYTLDGEKSARVPKPFPADFQYAEWIKLKRYTPASYVPEEFFYSNDAITNSIERLRLLIPLNRFLNYTVDESLNK